MALLLTAPLPAQDGAPPPAPKAGPFHFFPVNDVFRPLVADPKERQFFMSFLNYKTPREDFTAWSVGFGEGLGLLRWGRGLQSQVGFLAGVFSQFNWSAPSVDLINTDFTIGLASTHRWRGLSARFQYYHQSSHLGDELLLYNPIPRLNYSFNALEGVLSLEQGRARLYMGGERLLNRDPTSIKRLTMHAGGEFLGRQRGTFFRPVAGADLKWKQERNWYMNMSLKAGLEMGKPTARGRLLRLLGEYYHGYSPFGQFYDQKTQYWGGGLYLGF